MTSSGDHSSFSVVVPACNAGKTIRASLESVLTQTLSPREIIVIDDGSTDNTRELAEGLAKSNSKFPIRILSGPNLGAAAARNAGVLAATGDWIAFLDADDEWFPNKLSRCSALIQETNTLDFICHDQDEIYDDGTKLKLEWSKKFEPEKNLFLQLYWKGNFIGTSATLVRRNTLIKAGLFDESFISSQDYDLWMRVSQICSPVFLKESLGAYRPQPGGLSARVWTRLRATLRISEKYYPLLVCRSRHPRSIFYGRGIRWHLSSFRQALRHRQHSVACKIVFSCAAFAIKTPFRYLLSYFPNPFNKFRSEDWAYLRYLRRKHGFFGAIKTARQHWRLSRKMLEEPSPLKLISGEKSRSAADEIILPQFPAFPNSKGRAFYIAPLASTSIRIQKNVPWETRFPDPENVLCLHRWGWMLRLMVEDADPPTSEQVWSWVFDWIEKYAAGGIEQWPQSYSISERISNVLSLAMRVPVPKEKRAALARFIQDQARTLANNLEWKGELTNNHLLSNARGLQWAGTALQDENLKALSKETAKYCLEKMLTPNGFLREGSTHYHLLHLRNLSEMHVLAKFSGDHAWSEELGNNVSKMKEMAEYFLVRNGSNCQMPWVGDLSPDFPPEWFFGGWKRFWE